MDGLLNRYRNLATLLLLIAGQLLLLAWQIRSNGETRLIRIWAVTAVTPMARVLEGGRAGVGGIYNRWFRGGALETENATLRRWTADLRTRNQLLEEDLRQSGRQQALLEFRRTLPGKSLPASILGLAPGVRSGVYFVDRGSLEGVKRGMAVVTGDGIAGQVVAAYPTASLIMIATSQGFAAGVVSQTHRVRALLRGDGSSCHLEGIQNEQPVDEGEWFYTSGEDRVFPRGLRVGQAGQIRTGAEGKEVDLRPVALSSDLTEVLILLEAVHGQVPALATPAAPDMQILPAPPRESGGASAAPNAAAETNAPVNGPATDADRLKSRYRRIVESQGIKVGETPYRAPDFNRVPPPAAVTDAKSAAQSGAKPETKPQ